MWHPGVKRPPTHNRVRGQEQALTCYFLLVGADGFEPPTSAL
jgi:hypothetical protein